VKKKHWWICFFIGFFELVGGVDLEVGWLKKNEIEMKKATGKLTRLQKIMVHSGKLT